MSISVRRTFVLWYINWANILLQFKVEVTYVTIRTDIFAQIRLT